MSEASLRSRAQARLASVLFAWALVQGGAVLVRLCDREWRPHGVVLVGWVLLAAGDEFEVLT